jgi:hypothetical protein
MRIVNDLEQAVAAGTSATRSDVFWFVCSPLMQEIRSAEKVFSPEWDGLVAALRTKTTRENAEFLAAGLVKKLFQVIDSTNSPC